MTTFKCPGLATKIKQDKVKGVGGRSVESHWGFKSSKITLKQGVADYTSK